MTNILYSNDSDDFTNADESIQDVLVCFFENGGECQNGEVVLFSGTAHGYRASEMLPDIWEAMTDQAYDEMGEFSESWIYSLDENDAKLLQKRVAEFVDSYFDTSNNQPKFQRVENVKEVTVKVSGLLDEYPYFTEFEVQQC